MQDTGLAVHMDAAGTIIGRREGAEGGPTLLFGSHQDTVRHGGKYDGIMGVLLPILALRATSATSVQVMAFADEEGFVSRHICGPRTLCGKF